MVTAMTATASEEPAQLGADSRVAAVEPPAHRGEGGHRGDSEREKAGEADDAQGRSGTSPAHRVGDVHGECGHRAGRESDREPDRGERDGDAADGPAPPGSGHVAGGEPQQGKQQASGNPDPQPGVDPGAGQDDRAVMAQAVHDEDMQHDRGGAQRAEAKEKPGQTVLVRRAVRVAAAVAQHERGQERERRGSDQVDPGSGLDNGQVDAGLCGDHQGGGHRDRVDDRDRDRDPRPGRDDAGRYRVQCLVSPPSHRYTAWAVASCHGMRR